MEPIEVLVAAVIGYLVGSISFARIVTKTVAPQQDISRLELALPETAVRFESDAVSASTVRMHVGQRYGCLVSILDILKATLPSLAIRLWQPDTAYYLITAGMATIGHNWPIYYRFKGGRGLSPILGGMLVVDWLGVVVTNLIGAAIGLFRRDLVVMTGTGIVLMIPWIWLNSGEPAEVAYVVSMNVLFWTAMIPELREYMRLRREGALQDLVDAQQVQVLTREGENLIDQLTPTGFVQKITAPFRRKRF